MISEKWQSALAITPNAPPHLGSIATLEIAAALNILLADVYSLYVKTTNLQWHMSGRHFRDCHLLLEDHADQIFAMTDEISERVRKLGRRPLQSVDHISRLQRQAEYDAACTTPDNMFAELCENNEQLMDSLEEIQMLCAWNRDATTARLLEAWLDQVRRRIRSLSIAARHAR